MVNEAYSERQAIEQSMAKLKSAEEDFRFKFRQLLEGYMRLLQDQPDVHAEAVPPAPDFSRHAEADQGGHRARIRAERPETPSAGRPERVEVSRPSRRRHLRTPAGDAGATGARQPRGRAGARARRVQAGVHACAWREAVAA